MMNKLLLKQSLPTLRQILFWDNYLIPASKAVDPWFKYAVGKSIVAVWVRTE
jgi:hypothetical protein